MLIWTLVTASTLFTAWLFVSAAVHKLSPANQLYYVGVAENYGINSHELAKAGVLGTGLLELAIAAAVVIPATQSVGIAMGVSLLITYTLLIARQIAQGKAGMDCGCSGPAGRSVISPALLVRNLVLIGVVTLPVYAPLLHATPTWSFWLLAAATAAFAIITYVAVEQLQTNTQYILALSKKR